MQQQDPFAQLDQDFDAFKKLDEDFAKSQQMSPLGGRAQGVPTPPQAGQPIGGRMSGAGPMQQGNAGANPNERIGPNVGGFLRDNLPMAAGQAAAMGTAAATGGLSIPAQMLLTAGAATGGAGLGKVGEMEIREFQGLQAPPTWGAKAINVGDAAVTEGLIPELFGQALGGVSRVVGNVRSRIGAGKRNQKLVKSLADPKGLGGSPSGSEVGRMAQEQILDQRAAAEAPLTAEYDRVLKGPFGKAQVHKPVGPATVTGTRLHVPAGPTNASRHVKRSEALEDARGYAKVPDRRRDARRARARAEGHAKQIEQAAKDNGMSTKDYDAVSRAWARTQEQYGNAFMNQAVSQKGSNFIHTLTQPRSWKSYKPSGRQTKNDNPSLVKNLKANLSADPKAWDALTTAVQKRIVRESTDMHGNIRPQALERRLRQMLDGGASELLPQAKQLMEFAKTLDKHSGSMRVPTIGHKTGAVDRVLRATRLDMPDVGRIQTRKGKGWKGKGQKATERVGSAGAALATADYDELTVPEPPRR